MSETFFTHKDLAGLLGVSETTVKSYRRKFPGCIPVANRGKPIRFAAEAATVATRIRDFFETGMSVEEVRTRLSREFSWISPENVEKGGPPAARASGQRISRVSGQGREIGPEISVGVSNIAKSMVAMTQQHKNLATRLDAIDDMLRELGLKGRDSLDGTRGANAAARAREEMLESRLNRLDETTRGLADTVQHLAEELGRFLGRRENAAGEWKRNGRSMMEEAARISAEAKGESARDDSSADASGDAASAEEERESAGAEIFRLRPGPGGIRAENPRQSVAYGNETPESEPPRHFFSLPLVVRTGEGRYVSAGGRSRGRFSVNDLKALLMYGCMPPNHFTLRWEAHGKGWWLYLEQEKTGRRISLLLMELPTQKSGNVAEILKLINNDENAHPMEFHVVLESLGQS